MKKKLFGLLCAAMVLTMANGTVYASDAETADASTETQFGTNQDDAVLVPLNTKVYASTDNQYCWCSFTTNSNTDAEYKIIVINKSTEYNLHAYIFDEYGTQITSCDANKSGLASVISCDDLLSANTTYYIRFDSIYNNNGYYGDSTFVVTIRDLASTTTAIKTSDSINDLSDVDTTITATNQDDAVFVSLDEKYESKINESYNYFAFTATTSGEYLITVVNKSTEYNLYANIYDEYGTEIASGTANKDGTASTITCNDLSENTAYYVRFNAIYNNNGYYGDPDYSFIVRAPETEETESVIIEESYEETEELIFTVPFEINSTQVQFVINEATFIDEEAAKTAVEPVAEALLSHPDNAVLIAGTTATDGTQESCIDLSNRRAEAVKNLLVDEFGVPEFQIQTIGLGYEADPFERGQDREIEGDITSAFIESEAKKNRRVVIMDLESDIAQQILADNS
ncbi:MAG: OmpA family protein [Clostridiales bacterium]|nr:OmpA family protein [Clostridiales bacterium]